MLRRNLAALPYLTVVVILTLGLAACNFEFPGGATSTPDPANPKPKNVGTGVPTEGEPVFRFSAAEVTPFPFSTTAIESPVYETQSGTPVNLLNFVNPEAGCSWAGVAGQVFGADRLPVTGLVVEVGGTLEGKDVLAVTLTGGSLAMGTGGYELKLADHPVKSETSLHLQLFDLNGNVLSDVVQFDTLDTCDKNLVLVNFTHTSLVDQYFIPLISKNTGIHQP